MTTPTENEKIHDKLDHLFDMVKTNIETDPDKARDLIIHCLDLMRVNFNQLR
jgi:LytS/YehU family sensor histidine kinase